MGGAYNSNHVRLKLHADQVVLGSSTRSVFEEPEEQDDRELECESAKRHCDEAGVFVYYQGRIRDEGMQLTISPTCEQKLNSIYL